jgi:hypothetical protein
VARCPSCHESFCRECIVEHDHRLLCARCLRNLPDAAGPREPRSRFPLAAVFQSALGLALIWFGFYVLGLLLLRVPADVHDGLIWTR